MKNSACNAKTEGLKMLTNARTDSSILPNKEARKTTYKLNLNVSYKDKEEAKSLGAKWNGQKKLWYLPNRRMYSDRFSKWLSRQLLYQPLPEGGKWTNSKGNIFDILSIGDEYDKALSKLFSLAKGIEKTAIAESEALKLDVYYLLEGGIFGYSLSEEGPTIVTFRVFFEKKSSAKTAYKKIEKQVYEGAIDWESLGVDRKDYFFLGVDIMYDENDGEELASIISDCYY